MEEFKLPIDEAKFRSTNGMWNRLMLNDPWSVGYVSTLIELQEWESKEQWEQFYYANGVQRNALLGANADLLNDFSLVRLDPNKVKSLSWDLRNLNTQYGRTQLDLMERAKVLYQNTINNGFNLSLNDCYECVRFRVICETWNGIIVRENNTIANLRGLFPYLEFRKSDGKKDHQYAVDYEVYRNGRLICGLQIKPPSYMWNAPYIQKARYANAKKYEEYQKAYGVPVYTIISTNKGIINNTDILNKLK